MGVVRCKGELEEGDRVDLAIRVFSSLLFDFTLTWSALYPDADAICCDLDLQQRSFDVVSPTLSRVLRVPGRGSWNSSRDPG